MEIETTRIITISIRINLRISQRIIVLVIMISLQQIQDSKQIYIKKILISL